MPCTLTLLGFRRVAETFVVEFDLLVLFFKLFLEAFDVRLEGLFALLVFAF